MLVNGRPRSRSLPVPFPLLSRTFWPDAVSRPHTFFYYYSLCWHFHRMGARGVDTWVGCWGRGARSLSFVFVFMHTTLQGQHFEWLFSQAIILIVSVYLHHNWSWASNLSFMSEQWNRGTGTSLSMARCRLAESARQIPSVSYTRSTTNSSSSASVSSSHGSIFPKQQRQLTHCGLKMRE